MKIRILFLVTSLALTSACSVTGILANALSGAGGGTAFSGEDDPELVEQALAAYLKTFEVVIESQPRHVPLLTTLAKSFTQYAYLGPQQRLDQNPDDQALKERVVRLYLRARDYGLRGLSESHPGMGEALFQGKELEKVLAQAKKEDVPLLYWTSASWGAAIGNSGMDLADQFPIADAMARRALELEEAWDEGAIHSLLISYDATHASEVGDQYQQSARRHMERALALSQNKSIGPLVTYAEKVLMKNQDEEGFREMLKKVLQFNADAPANRASRLPNVLAQRKARWSLANMDRFF